jgi:hypothetical protein
MLPTKFQFIWESGFRGGDFLEINQSEKRMAYFLPSFDSFGLAVSEEKIFFRNQPIRNKNCL